MTAEVHRRRTAHVETACFYTAPPSGGGGVPFHASVLLHSVTAPEKQFFHRKLSSVRVGLCPLTPIGARGAAWRTVALVFFTL